MKYISSLFATLLLGACAATTPQDEGKQAESFEEQDPIKPVNEVVFNFNLKADRHVIKPTADAYHSLPETVRLGTSNFLSNLTEPGNFVNGVLQLNPDIIFSSFWRFTLNTTFGFAGLRDFAGAAGLLKKPSNFGETLRAYGVADGAYVVLPILGPSNVRNSLATPVDWFFLNPIYNYLTLPQGVVQTVAEGVVARDEQDVIINQLYYKSLEPYTASRAAYLQHQAFQ